ncbi:GNAT family N-acetyltransferase [Antrihabitans cavernicola]|uniref:GNAT family N-acetyltransferase n=1 Tax=Antrihabitans cavernicola TaxID=2495913 RepID=A0A5A7SAI7_9NOCA|nr:GNAT family N-acetyltransferase [Spelaeibacter cavernicola]KAA0021231.1 GNAT family N-acetyltransferase [Spelaeibacter cavernicola]
MNVVSLSDGTVWLSAPDVGDIDAIAQHCQDPEVAEWTTLPSPYTRADAQAFLDRTEAGWRECSPTWGIRTSTSGELVGMAGLIDRGEWCAEIGYWLAPTMRGRGTMTAAVRLVCDYGFRADGMSLERIEWRAFVGNVGSAVVARRCAFRFEGTLRLGVQRGVRRDAWVAGRLRTDSAAQAEEWPIR